MNIEILGVRRKISWPFLVQVMIEKFGHAWHCIHFYLDLNTDIATSVVYCKLDLCNSLYYSLPNA